MSMYVLGAKELPFEKNYKGNESKYLFPGQDQDPLFKSDPQGAYVKKVIEAMYARIVNGRLGNLSFYSKAELLRLYSQGRQPQSIYETWAYGGKAYPTDYVAQIVNGVDQDVTSTQQKLMKGWHNVNFSVISPFPKIMSAIDGMLDNVDYDIFADTLDPVSNDKVEDSAWGLWVYNRYKEWFAKAHQSIGVPSSEPEFVPDSIEELNMYKASEGLKLNCARLMQMLIRYTSDISNDDELNLMLRHDLITLSKAVKMDVIDMESKKVKYEYVDPATFFIQPSTYNDFRDSTYGGRVKEIDISYLAAMGIDRDKLKTVAKSYCSLLGNPPVSEWDNYEIKIGDDSWGYDFFKVAVIDAAWIEEDTKYKRYVRNRFGRVKSYDAEYGYQSLKDNEWVKKFTTRVVYEGSWIIGSDIVYSFGIMWNQPRDGDFVKLPFHVYSLPNISMVEASVPFLDEFQFCWLMYQNGMALAPPDGVAIDMSMIVNLDASKEKVATATDVINFVKRTRYYPYQKSPSGKYEGGNPTPFSPVVGITEKILKDTDVRFQICLNRISDVTGVSMLSTGTNPTNVQATTAELNYNATINTLKPIVRGVFRIKESAAYNACWRIKNSIKYEPSFAKSYSGVLCEMDVQALKDAEKWGVQYGIKLRARPSDKDIQNIYEGLNISIQNGDIDESDRLYVVEQINAKVDLKLIRMYLAYKIKKNKKAKERQQMDAIERQNQGNLALKQQEGQSKAQEAQIDMQKESQLLSMKHQNEMEQQKDQNKSNMDELMMKIQADQEKNNSLVR